MIKTRRLYGILPPLVGILFFPILTRAAVSLGEAELLQLSKGQNPTLEQIEAAYLSSKTLLSEFNDEFSGKVVLSGSYSKTNEQGIISFVPVFSPTRQGDVSYQKKFRQGITLQSGMSISQSTALESGVNKATTQTLYAGFELDLWKDLMGRSSLARERALKLSNEYSRLEKDVNQRIFEINIRRLYWSLIANQESKKVHLELKEASRKQLRDAKKRLTQSVSDRGEVARYEAQLASRKATLTFLEYQRQTIERELRKALPALSSNPLLLKPQKTESTVEHILECTKKITAHNEAPLSYTLYDEMASALENSYTETRKAHQVYNDIDLKLSAQLGTTGVDNIGEGSIGGAWDDLTGNNRFGYDIGVSLTIPIGEGKTENLRIIRDEKKTRSQSSSLTSQIKSTHLQLFKSIELLAEATRLQKVSSENLKIRMKDITKKYNQARISVTEMIADQDAYLNANLSVIDVQLQLINTLLDYFAVFTETPCAFNQPSLHRGSE